jgi:hypothetical protein
LHYTALVRTKLVLANSQRIGEGPEKQTLSIHSRRWLAMQELPLFLVSTSLFSSDAGASTRRKLQTMSGWHPVYLRSIASRRAYVYILPARVLRVASLVELWRLREESHVGEERRTFDSCHGDPRVQLVLDSASSASHYQPSSFSFQCAPEPSFFRVHVFGAFCFCSRPLVRFVVCFSLVG